MRVRVPSQEHRLEEKQAVRRVRKIGNAHIFEAVVARDAAQGRLVDELLKMFGGFGKPIVSHLIESGGLTIEDIHDAEKTLREMAKAV